MELSKRLYAAAALVTPGNKVADIGTDHGYIPIYLLESGICQRAVAMDVNEGPLERAREHIAGYGLDNYIETRLSDGLQALNPGEVQTAVIAGMGGALVIKIMDEGKAVADFTEEFILQPQSEIEKVRRFLAIQGYIVTGENMIEEDGKYYPMMQVRHGMDTPYSLVELRYGRILLKNQSPVLFQYLMRERHIKKQILEELWERSGSRIEIRQQEVTEELQCVQQALQYFN